MPYRAMSDKLYSLRDSLLLFIIQSYNLLLIVINIYIIIL
jgi:hypothetical protein